MKTGCVLNFFFVQKNRRKNWRVNWIVNRILLVGIFWERISRILRDRQNERKKNVESIFNWNRQRIICQWSRMSRTFLIRSKKKMLWWAVAISPMTQNVYSLGSIAYVDREIFLYLSFSLVLPFLRLSSFDAASNSWSTEYYH